MGTFDWKIVKVNYKTTVPMNDCDKVLLDVFNSSKVWIPVDVRRWYIVDSNRDTYIMQYL